MPTFYEKLCAYDKTKEIKKEIIKWEKALRFYTSTEFSHQHLTQWENLGSPPMYDMLRKIRALEKELDELIEIVG
jgi:cell fate (sporulation/competence/biofilm development) regulator YlbF (YheA/YmcA/DUF963 family)